MSVLKRISKYLSSGGKGQALDQEMIDKLTEIKNGLGPWQIHMAALCQKAFRQLSSTDSTLNFGLMQIFASGLMGGTHGEFNALELLFNFALRRHKRIISVIYVVFRLYYMIAKLAHQSIIFCYFGCNSCKLFLDFFKGSFFLRTLCIYLMIFNQ